MRLRDDVKADTHSIAEAVQLRLENDILTGKLLPGRRLRLHSLTQSYDVGMSPLREALSRLAGQGLVVQESQRGFAVVPISHSDLADVTDTRVRLETMAFTLAIETGDSKWEAEILSAHHQLARHARGARHLIDEEWERLHRAFHLSLIAGCGSPVLLSFCQVLYNHFDRYRRIAVRTARRQPTISKVHGRLVEAAIERRKTDAIGLLSAHIKESEKEILRLAGERMFLALTDTDEQDEGARVIKAKPKRRVNSR